MGRKNIRLNEEAYQALLKFKRPGMSFTDVINEFFDQKERLINIQKTKSRN